MPDTVVYHQNPVSSGSANFQTIKQSVCHKPVIANQSAERFFNECWADCYHAIHFDRDGTSLI